MSDDTKRLEEVADVLHEDIMNLDSSNDKGVLIDKLTAVEECLSAKEKLEVDREKLKIERLKIEAEKPPEKTRWDKFIETTKAVAPIVAPLITVGGIIIHELVNRANFKDGCNFEKDGTFRDQSAKPPRFIK